MPRGNRFSRLDWPPGWVVDRWSCNDSTSQYAAKDNLIGLAGFTDDCGTDEEGQKPKVRPWIDKGPGAARTLVDVCSLKALNRLLGLPIVAEHVGLNRRGSRIYTFLVWMQICFEHATDRLLLPRWSSIRLANSHVAEPWFGLHGRFHSKSLVGALVGFGSFAP